MSFRNNKFWILRFGGVILSGIMLAASFPGIGQSTLIFAALVPLLLSIQSLPNRLVILFSWLSGMVFFGISLSWFWQMINTVDIWLFKIATGLAYFFIISYCAIYFIPFGLASVWFGKRWGHKSFKKNIFIMSVMTALWIALEYLRGILFTGFGWNVLGVSQYTNPVLIQIASWGGVAAVSAFIVWMNMGIFLTIRQYVEHKGFFLRRPHFELMLGLIPIALSIVFGLQIIFGEYVIGKPVHVGLLQPNIPQLDRRDANASKYIHDRLRMLSLTALKARDLDLLVWPETALPGYAKLSFSCKKLVREVASKNVPLLVGSMDFDDTDGQRRIFNSSLLFNGNDEPITTYNKQHLVPFGEYVPFEKLLRSITPLDIDFTAGTEQTLFKLDTSPAFSVLICFEDTKANLAREAVRKGARWIINQTNDAWFDPSFQSEQHLAHSVFRCVENHIPMVRSCNTGVTAIIDPFGRIERRLDPLTSGFLIGTVYPDPLTLHKTIYTEVGDLFSKTMLISSLSFFVFAGINFRNKK